MSKKHTIELSKETYELVQQVKTVFISYTGDKEKDRSDEKVIDILAGGFFDQLSHAQHEHEEWGCCGGSCGCDDSDCGDKCDDDCGCDDEKSAKKTAKPAAEKPVAKKAKK